jgi:hypothetical protein
MQSLIELNFCEICAICDLEKANLGLEREFFLQQLTTSQRYKSCGAFYWMDLNVLIYHVTFIYLPSSWMEQASPLLLRRPVTTLLGRLELVLSRQLLAMPELRLA